MARSYNRIELIGNLASDPELRTTPKGTSVCSFRLATDRMWKDDHGDRQEETAFHRIVAWATLADQCASFLRKGRKVFVAGRLSYRTYTDKVEGTERIVAEIVIDEMLLLDSKPTDTKEPKAANPTPPAAPADDEMPV
jgi:single-strand DNA-binding protein